MKPLRPCLVCQAPTRLGSRCHVHALTAHGHAHRQAREHLLATSPEVCHLCGEGPRDGDEWEADHLVPKAHGGHDTPSNYARAHRSCNRSKGKGTGGGLSIEGIQNTPNGFRPSENGSFASVIFSGR